MRRNGNGEAKPEAAAAEATPPAEPRKFDRISEWLLYAQIIGVTIFQKVPVPISSKTQLFFGMFILMGVTGFGIFFGRLRVRTAPMVLYAVMAGGLVLGQLAGQTEFSVLSISELIVIHIPYVVSLRENSTRPLAQLSFYQDVMSVIAILGVIQFAAQFVIGWETAFFLDAKLPPKFTMQGYHALNPLRYGGHVFKSNGVFFLEPAGLSQFLAVSVIIEFLYFRRIIRYGIFMAGLLVAFSGTGLIILGILTPVLLIRRKQIALLLAGAAVLVVVFIFADDLGLGLYVKRLNEFNNEQSSGFARFVSIFYLLDDFVLNTTTNMLFGRGAGSIKTFFDLVNFTAHEPSWGKILFEYGLVGVIFYFPLMFYTLWSAKQSGYLRAALTIQFLILGGYVLIPTVHGLIVALLSWPATAIAAKAAKPAAAATQAARRLAAIEARRRPAGARAGASAAASG